MSRHAKRKRAKVRGPKPSAVAVDEAAEPPRARPYRGPVDVRAILNRVGAERFWALAGRWEDEAAELALAGNPRRAHYVEQYWVPIANGLADACLRGMDPRTAR